MSTATSPTAPDGHPFDRPHPGASDAAGSTPTSGPSPSRDADGHAGGIRASNAEREETVAALHAALGDGRLDLEETDGRVATAYAARYRSELPPLLADLPGGAADPHRSTSRTGGAPSWTELWRSLVWRLRALLLGAGASAPTARDERWAAVALGVGAAWALICAVVAAALVAA